MGLMAGLNTYGFVIQNPIRHIDFFGLAEVIPLPGAPPLLPQMIPGTPENQAMADSTMSAIDAISDAIPDSPLGNATTIDIIMMMSGTASAAVEGKLCKSKDDDDFCFRRWEKEDTNCKLWSFLGPRAVNACKERASDRRTLCIRNGGRPDPEEPDEWTPSNDYMH